MSIKKSARRVAEAALRDALGSKPRVLAWGSGPDTLVAGMAEAFAVYNGSSWKVTGYHRIARGGWRPTDDTLWWEDVDGDLHEVGLTDPGRFTELFRERVSATIMVDRVVGEPGLQARFVVRRNLADPDAPMTWIASPVGTTKTTDPGFAELVEAGVSQLKADYGII